MQISKIHKSGFIFIFLFLFFAISFYISPNANSFLSPANTTVKIYLNQRTHTYTKQNDIYSTDYKVIESPRVIALKEYLKRHGSPMAEYSELIVSEADKYNQDWRIIVAIAGVESAFGTITPYGSCNAWGWRGGPNGNFSQFKDWPTAIKYITKNFTNGYGINPDPFAIESTYCPPCGQNPAHAWANGVTRYKNEITALYKQIIKDNPSLKKVK